MNVHIGSWIVPVLATLVAMIRVFYTIGHKVMGKVTWADATRRGTWKSPDEATQAAVAFMVLSGGLLFSLLAWFIWGIIIYCWPLTCGI